MGIKLLVEFLQNSQNLRFEGLLERDPDPLRLADDPERDFADPEPERDLKVSKFVKNSSV